MIQFQRGDRVKVEYSFGKFFEGTVLWTERAFGKIDWAYIRPDDDRYVATFGGSSDMANGYKGYIYNDPVLGQVTPL